MADNTSPKTDSIIQIKSNERLYCANPAQTTSNDIEKYTITKKNC